MGGKDEDALAPPLRKGGNDKASVNQESGISSVASLSPVFRFLLTEADLEEIRKGDDVGDRMFHVKH